jgi:ketosteroid isomerase-like protein
MAIDEKRLNEFSTATLSAVQRFQTAVDRRDVSALRDAIADDCVFECPKNNRFVGQEMVDMFARLFGNPGVGRFATEELIVAGDRAVARWLLSLDDGNGGTAQLRGVDVFRVRNGAVAEVLSYVKDEGDDE